jgi:hypothetical protein
MLQVKYAVNNQFIVTIMFVVHIFVVQAGYAQLVVCVLLLVLKQALVYGVLQFVPMRIISPVGLGITVPAPVYIILLPLNIFILMALPIGISVEETDHKVSGSGPRTPVLYVESYMLLPLMNLGF